MSDRQLFQEKNYEVLKELEKEVDKAVVEENKSFEINGYYNMADDRETPTLEESYKRLIRNETPKVSQDENESLENSRESVTYAVIEKRPTESQPPVNQLDSYFEDKSVSEDFGSVSSKPSSSKIDNSLSKNSIPKANKSAVQKPKYEPLPISAQPYQNSTFQQPANMESKSAASVKPDEYERKLEERPKSKFLNNSPAFKNASVKQPQVQFSQPSQSSQNPSKPPLSQRSVTPKSKSSLKSQKTLPPSQPTPEYNLPIPTSDSASMNSQRSSKSSNSIANPIEKSQPNVQKKEQNPRQDIEVKKMLKKSETQAYDSKDSQVRFL
jgi:hypothetical protein